MNMIDIDSEALSVNEEIIDPRDVLLYIYYKIV
jgi:hypothetical protein